MSEGVFTLVQRRGHEQIVFFNYPLVGLKAIIAIHNTTLGPALGGCRIRQYDNESKALDDVLRLSEGMTYKSALAGMPLGGGKACIIGDPLIQNGREELLIQFGRCVESLGGRYVTAEDMGVSVDDIAIIRTQTKHATGRPPATNDKGASGDPSPWTARGVFMAMQAAAEQAYGSKDLKGKRVLVEGVGHVGEYILEHLIKAGAVVTITDARDERIQAVRSKYGINAVPLNSLYDVPADIFSPCAIGQTVSADSIRRLSCTIICGAANNQIADPSVYSLIEQKEMLYCPDFVVNAGGVISAGAELNEGGWNKEWVSGKIDRIPLTLTKIVTESKNRKKSTEAIALELAREIIDKAEQDNLLHGKTKISFSNSSL